MSDKENPETTTPGGIALMREPFPANQISQLPKPTKRQTDDVKADFKAGIRCDICGQWHHPKVVHLDYVGHAALTSRLLECDEEWNWEPVSATESGLPVFDKNGGMWIRLTVCGVTRLGYGDAPGKSGGNAVKEVIGDALRNAAMRFGAALDLWHKGELHVGNGDEGGNANPVADVMIEEPAPRDPRKVTDAMIDAVGRRDNTADLMTCIKAQRFTEAEAWLEKTAPPMAAELQAVIATRQQDLETSPADDPNAPPF